MFALRKYCVNLPVLKYYFFLNYWHFYKKLTYILLPRDIIHIGLTVNKKLYSLQKVK